MEIKEKDYLDILAILEKRTKHTKIIILTFVYILFFR
jgi:hypothetical protein